MDGGGSWMKSQVCSIIKKKLKKRPLLQRERNCIEGTLCHGCQVSVLVDRGEGQGAPTQPPLSWALQWCMQSVGKGGTGTCQIRSAP